MYTPSSDFARVPLTREATAASEMLSLSIQNGKLRIQWDDTAWLVPIVPKQTLH